jgi:hypothetical protein
MSDATISKTRPSKPLARPAKPTPAKSKAPVAAPARPAETRGDTVQVKPKEKAAAPAPPSLLAGLGQNFPPQNRGEAIAEQAKKLVGTSFKGSEEKRCADFVSHVISQSGQKPEGFKPTLLAAEFGRMGADKIKPEDFKPGDVVAFNNTWRDSKGANDHTHVGVYVGDGQFVHRPTNQADYLPGSKPGEVIQESIEDYLKRPRSRPAEVTGAYRF